MMRFKRCLLAAASLTLLAGSALAAVEMSSSAIVFYNSDFKPGTYWEKDLCTMLMERAAQHGGRRVQLVPTMYWYDKRNEGLPSDTCRPDGWAETDQRVDYYCNKEMWDSPCAPFNPQVINEFKTGLARCFKRSFQLFDEVLIAPHLDDGLKKGHWRNLLHFDPLKKDANGYTYWDIMIKPILDALNEVAPAGKTVWFGMEGEMGGTVLSYPVSYTKVAQQIRGGWKSKAKLLVGVTMNHAYLYGYINRGPAPFGPMPVSKMQKYDGGFGPVLPLDKWPGAVQLKKRIPAIKHLLTEVVDFLGISNYARASANPTPGELESAIRKYEDELAVMGISLQSIMKTKKFIMNEFAIGGGVSECGNVPADAGKDAGLYPWLGITTPYTDASMDPWKRKPGVKAYLIEYYKAGLALLKRGGIKYKVDGCYLWNLVSWDVQGIHTASAVWNAQDPFAQGFGVREVADMIKTHNRAVNGAKKA